MQDRNITRWPMMVAPDDTPHELSLTGRPPVVVTETPEEIHRRLNQPILRKRQNAVALVHMP